MNRIQGILAVVVVMLSILAAFSGAGVIKPGHEYAATQFAVEVDSSPAGILFHVNGAPYAGYTGNAEYGETLLLSAPLNATIQGRAFSFAYWEINGEAREPRYTGVEQIITGSVSARAIYFLTGDVDNNCAVDTADLILIRNRLGEDAGSGNNWLADVNRDGLVNIIDLVFVRERLGTNCPPPPPDPDYGAMAYVSEGTFTTSTGEEVCLDAYYIDIYEVSNALYCEFLNSGGKDEHWHETTLAPPNEQQIIKHQTGDYSVAEGMEQRPVRHVDWDDAVAFCDWRSEMEGLPQGTYHLPTEAQWEKAAGWDADEGKLWTYGIASDEITPERANYGRNAGETTDAGHYHPWKSCYGIFDAVGNVNEWCQDWYGSAYPSEQTNPAGPDTGTKKVLRGGDWAGPGDFCRVAVRHQRIPTHWSECYGFRCARTAK